MQTLITKSLNTHRVITTLFAASVFAAGCTATTPAPRFVDINTADGTTLKATLFGAAKTGPAVLLLHQCDEQRKVWDALGTRLAKSGINAMSVDYRGYGESGGTPHDKLAPADLEKMMQDKWPSDIESAFAFLAQQRGVDTARMAAAGGSCGVNNAVHVAMNHTNVKALALLAGGIDHAGRAFIESPQSPPIFTGAAADDKYANFVAIMSWYHGMSPNAASRSIHYQSGGHAAMVFNAQPDFADSVAKWFSAVLGSGTTILPTTNGHRMPTEMVQVLHDIDQPGGAAKVALQLAEARKTKPNAQLFLEYFINQIGYEHMQMKDMTGAIEIMKLEVTAYPDSPNAMDSLGDVYLASGDKKNALTAARQTLVLLAKDTVDTPERMKNIRASADAKIKQLTAP